MEWAKLVLEFGLAAYITYDLGTAVRANTRVLNRIEGFLISRGLIPGEEK